MTPAMVPSDVAARMVDLAHHVVATTAAASLTERERQVLVLVAAGLSDQAIGHQLRISSRTVGSHLVNINRKWQTRSRTEAVVTAIRAGVVRL